jgi:hypothetical protein
LVLQCFLREWLVFLLWEWHQLPLHQERQS